MSFQPASLKRVMDYKGRAEPVEDCVRYTRQSAAERKLPSRSG